MKVRESKMYDIITDIWKNPGAAYSAMPIWLWNDTLDKDKLVKQLDDFHRKGVDSVIIKPGTNMGVEYLSDEYFDIVKAVCDEAKRRFMLVAIEDDCPCDSVHSRIIAEDRRFMCRRLYARPVNEEVHPDEETLYRLYLKFDEDKLVDTKLACDEGYTGYNFILGYADTEIVDPLNSYATDSYIKYTHEVYYENLQEYFGKTIIGFYNSSFKFDETSVNSVLWSYSMTEEFFEAGGEITALAHLLFATKEKKLSREAEHIYHTALRKNLNLAYYIPLSNWCRDHGVTLMGYAITARECELLNSFHIPGQQMTNNLIAQDEELTSRDSMIPKLAADCARHAGVSRSSCTCFDEKEGQYSLTPDVMMRQLNFLFARGCSMIIPSEFSYSVKSDAGPNTVWWKNYRKVSDYIKRMSWLGATGTNNANCAVLCSSEHVPTAPVRALYENGYSFNYLSIDDFMNKAHVHDGQIHIDRYLYDIVLIDGRLRLSAEIVKKLGYFVTEGGKMYRGSAFGEFMRKNAKKTSYFDGETHGKLRFTHYNKSGCDFFLFVNEGTEEIIGRFVTDISCAAADFDPFTGKTAEMLAEMIDGGFAYDVNIPAHSVKVIGMNPKSLPKLGKNDEYKLCEIVALTEGRMEFDYYTAENKVAKLRFTAIRDVAEIKVNDEEVTSLMFMPNECDITKFLHDGENKVEVNVLGADNAGFDGCTVRVFEKI